MDDLTALSKSELLSLVRKKDAAVKHHQSELEDCNAELRRRDIARQEQDQKLEELSKAHQKLSEEYVELQLAFNKLLAERFGNQSERYIDDPDQLRLDLGDTDEAEDAASGLDDATEDADLTPVRRRKKRRRRNERLPEHLERYETIADVDPSLKYCSVHGERVLLPEAMWDTTETLEFERPRLRVRVTKYPKYACKDNSDCGVTSPPRPTGLVEGDKYAASIAAEIITGKFGYHIPIYRQQDFFAGCGWTPGRSTLLNILKQSDFVIQSLIDFFTKTLQTDSIVGCDDTSVTLLYPKTPPTFDEDDPKQRRAKEVYAEALKKNKPSIRAKMWAYRGVTIPLNVFDFTVSRHRDSPELFFANFEGTLVGDCWSGFESIVVASSGKIKRSACNSHARRKFEKSQAYPKDAKTWLRWYQQLFDIEERGKTMSTDERLQLRQAEAKPIWDQILNWLDEIDRRTTNVILPKSDMGKAVQYVRNHLTELMRYLDDGALPIDNNLTEHLMRQVAVGRKNWLFAGSLEGGQRSANFLTLVSSALRNDLDVWEYVKDVLESLLSGVTDYEPLLPWNWAKAHPESIRQYRADERQARAARKTAKRNDRRRRKKASKE